MLLTTTARRLLLVAIAIALGAAVLAGPVEAAEPGPDVSLSARLAAERSAVAVPFIGEYEVWCTDRNPAPFSLCSNHHLSPAIDIGMDIGEPIYAAGVGVVTNLETTCRAPGCRGGAGLFVELTHGDGTQSRYLHLDSVTVAEDDVVAVGQLLGTSGATGQSSSPHLHYDERDLNGVRTPMGTWFGCVGGEVVQYPQVFGTSDWNQVEYGSIVANEGYGCLQGLEVPAAAPIVLAGPGLIGISSPDPTLGGELQVVTIVGEEDPDPDIRNLSILPGQLLRIPATLDATVSVQFRADIGGVLTPWSESVVSLIIADDRPTCFGLYASVEGTNGTTQADVIIGTDTHDTINGGDGPDLICGLDGNDTIEAGDGADRVAGGDGRDIIFGGDGRDTVFGGPSADVIDGGTGRDRLDGGQGADRIDGNAGSDLINGATGDDELIGSGGRDRIRGGQGDDRITGGRGNDRITGNVGDDWISGGVDRDRCIGGGEAGDSIRECEV